MTERNPQHRLKSQIKLHRTKRYPETQKIYNCNHSKTLLVFFALPTTLFFATINHTKLPLHSTVVDLTTRRAFLNIDQSL